MASREVSYLECTGDRRGRPAPMARAERSDADADEEPGVIAVQTTLLNHVIRDVARGPTASSSSQTSWAAMIAACADEKVMPLGSVRLGSCYRPRRHVRVGAATPTRPSSATNTTRPATSERAWLANKSGWSSFLNLSAEQKRECLRTASQAADIAIIACHGHATKLLAAAGARECDRLPHGHALGHQSWQAGHQ